MRARWLVPALSVAFLAALVWGYGQYQARRSWEIHTENQYNRAFSELTANMGGLETLLSKAMVSNSPPILLRCFFDIWRRSYASRENLGQLPLTAVELSRTKTFVAKVAAFTYGLAVNRDLHRRPLSEKEWRTLRDMRRQARYVSARLAALQESILSGNVRWLDVDRLGALSAAGEGGRSLQTNKVTKSFVMMENGLKRLPDPDFEGNTLNFKETPRGLTGPVITVEQGREIARRFVPGGARLRAAYEGRNRGNFPVYVYSLRSPGAKGTAPVRLAISVKGGHVAWMLKERSVAGSRLSLAQARQRAEAFLSARGFSPLAAVAAESYNNVSVVSLAHVDDGYVVYPELIKVQVARDNGEILAVEAVPYLTFHRPGRTIPRPRLGAASARARLNPHLRVERLRPAVVLDDRYKEVPCWEATGRLEGQRFRVYLSAADGAEVKIQRIDSRGAAVE